MDDLIRQLVAENVGDFRGAAALEPGHVGSRIVDQAAPEFMPVLIQEAYTIAVGELARNVADAGGQQAASFIPQGVGGAFVERERALRLKREGDPMLAAAQPGACRQ